MSEEILSKLNQRLIDILSPEKGYFGRVYTWGQKPTKYEYIGYELSEDFLSTLQNMNETQIKTFKKIMTYFEVHAIPLKSLLITGQQEKNFNFYYETSWSQFMTVIMFGMLEIVAKGGKKELYRKGEKIKQFLQNNLSHEIKQKVSERYSKDRFSKKEVKNYIFSDVIDHLWDQIRSGFIHDGGFESKGLEWSTFCGMGSKNDPLTIKSDVPMQELLQITWQAILSSFGYKGSLILPSYNKQKTTHS